MEHVCVCEGVEHAWMSECGYRDTTCLAVH